MASIRGLTASFFTVAIGGVTAIAVAMSSFQLLEQAADAEEEQFAARLEVVARAAALQVDLGALGLAEPSPPLEALSAAREALGARLEAVRQAGEALEVRLVDRQRATLAASGPGSEHLSWAPPAVMSECDFDLALTGRASMSPVLQPAIGEPIRALCAPVNDASGAPAAVLVVVGKADYVQHLAAVELSTRARVVALGAMVGLLTILGMRLVLGPVEAATDAARRIAQGVRGVRIPEVGPSELRALAGALNEVGNQVDVREDEIRARLGAMAQLTSMVAHEVRNPLQSLSLLVSLARLEEDPTEREQLLTSIEAEIRALEGVVQTFLRSSGPVQISRVASDLVDVTRLALQVATTIASTRGVEVSSALPSRLPMSMDGSLVRRAIENLLLNAVEFSSQEPAGRVRVSVERQGATALVIVDDSGPGVPEAERDRIFKAYYSSKAGGTGLGLALVKQVFEAHGGSIRCESSPLGGARFRGVLPIGDDLEVPFGR